MTIQGWAALILMAMAAGTAASAADEAVENATYRTDPITAQAPAPVVFAPGVISGGTHDSAPAFSPDGQTVYFSRSTPSGAAILVSHREGDGWSSPGVAVFSGVWNDLEPAMAPDGSYLLFISNRPVTAGGAPLDGYFNGKVQPGQGGNLWRVDREERGWGAPRRLPETINEGSAVYAPAIARDGTVFFMRPDPDSKRFRLYAASPAGSAYTAATALPFSTGAATDVDPAVEPDQRFLIFGSSRLAGRSIDLFVSFRTPGGWGTPIHLGDVINSPGSDAEPRLSPDGQSLYFSSERMVAQHFPRSHADAVAAMADADRWNNGLYNIWQVPIRPLLERLAAGETGAR